MQKVTKQLLIDKFGTMAKAARHYGVKGPSAYYWITAGMYMTDCGKIVAVHAVPV